MLFRSYSDVTVCPECHKRVPLEDVKLTPTFSCPHCQAIIGASDAYRRTMTWTVAILSLLIPYLLGAKYWLVLLLWVPLMAIMSFLWAYIGKYWLPPRLVRSVVESTSTLGLGSRPPEQAGGPSNPVGAPPFAGFAKGGKENRGS